MNEDLKLIKKYYGEQMMHLCRELFPTILEKEGLLFKLLSDNFYYSKFLYEDIMNEGMVEEFKDYIYSYVDVENEEQITTSKTPFELLEEAGYTLYECKTEEDIQSFKKYYYPGEELCTFRGNRLNSCYVFFAVKKDADSIKREDFIKPSRQDSYGTSVISIQFRRGEKNNLSIKNRYNHTVNNPDSTFHNNLDNIIPGLTNSFERDYHLNILRENSDCFELYDYTMDTTGKWFKYNYEINNAYYGPNNLVVDNFEKVPFDDPARMLILDYYIFDLEHKTIKCFDSNIVDTFPAAFNKIDKIEINKLENSKDKEMLIHHDGVISRIVFDMYNCIISLEYNGDMEKMSSFMFYNRYLKELKIDKVKKVSNFFNNFNRYALKSISGESLEEIGDYSFLSCINLKDIKFPNLKKIGGSVFRIVSSLEVLDLPSLEFIDMYSFYECSSLKEIIAPKLKRIGKASISNCKDLEKMDIPSIEIIDEGCFNNCDKLIRDEKILEAINNSKIEKKRLNSIPSWIYYLQDEENKEESGGKQLW